MGNKMSNPYEEGDEIVVVFILKGSKPSQRLRVMLEGDPVFQNHIREKTRGLFFIDINEDREWFEFANPQLFPTMMRYKMVDGEWVEQTRLVGNAPIDTIIDYFWIEVKNEV
jgi:hypothetical protein